MARLSRLVEELLDPNISVILIKGSPGAGKTTLALELALAYGRGVYISTRVSESRLLYQFPHAARMVEEGRLKGSSLDKGLLFHDHRMASADNIVGAVTEAALTMDKPLVILDSWDAVAKELPLQERLKAEKNIATFAEAGGAKVIFVSEEPELTTTDYIADAIVVLHDDEVEGRRFRKLELLKLRGKPIPVKYVSFTLANARFTLLSQAMPVTAASIRSLVQSAFRKRGAATSKLSTGIAELDELVQPALKGGSLMSIEIGPTVPLSSLVFLIVQFKLSVIRAGGCLVGVPSGTLHGPLLEMITALKEVDPEAYSRIKIGCIREHESCFRIDPVYPGVTFRRITETAKSLQKKYGGPCLVHVALDFLENLYEPSALPRYIALMSSELASPEYLLHVCLRSGSPLVDKIESLSGIYLRLVERDGGLFVYRVKPFSPLYGILLEEGSVRLVPIM